MARPHPVPAVELMRTEQERRDPSLAWARADPAFFASGACHVLAARQLVRMGSGPGSAWWIRPRDGLPGNHVVVLTGAWGFDFNGWSVAGQLLATNRSACRRRWPGWEANLVELVGSLQQWCDDRPLRPPADFPGDVLSRADRYLERFPPLPPG